MTSLVSEIDDEKLEALVRARVTPELIEWLKRLQNKTADPKTATTSAHFNHLFGSWLGKGVIIDEFQRLLSEAHDPEFKE